MSCPLLGPTALGTLIVVCTNTVLSLGTLFVSTLDTNSVRVELWWWGEPEGATRGAPPATEPRRSQAAAPHRGAGHRHRAGRYRHRGLRGADDAPAGHCARPRARLALQ